MPKMRNIKSRRSSGAIPIEYDGPFSFSLLIQSPKVLMYGRLAQGWEIPHTTFSPYPRSSVSLSSTASTPSLSHLNLSYHPPRQTKPPRRGDSGHVPRPRNAFIIFRSHFNRMSGGPDQNQISIRAGKAWNQLTEDEKYPFTALAEKEKLEHQAKFPNYTYAPTTKGNSRKRKPAQKKVKPIPTKMLTPRFVKEDKVSPTHLPFFSCDNTSSQPPPMPVVSTTPVVAEPPESLEPMLDLTGLHAPTSENLSASYYAFIPIRMKLGGRKGVVEWGEIEVVKVQFRHYLSRYETVHGLGYIG